MHMGYSCTAASLRTLQIVKALYGADLKPDNEIRLRTGRLVFFERGDERPDGAIAGVVHDLRGETVGSFFVDAEGIIQTFAGLTAAERLRANVSARDGSFRAEWRAVI
jgi:hypothetical protein